MSSADARLGRLSLGCARLLVPLHRSLPGPRIWAEAFAGGAVLTMLADSMMPEALQHGGRTVSLITVLGYLVAAALAVAQ